MFDLTFSFFQAWSQLGLIVMALVFLLIGGGILGNVLYWRIKARRVRGRIVAVMVKGRPLKKGENKTDKPSSGHSDSTDNQKPGIFFVLLFIGIPLIFMGIGGYMGYTYFSLKASGVYVQARVNDNERSTDSDGGTTYKAVLQFRDKNGRSWTVKDNVSYGSSPSYNTGTQVGVYYDPQDPENFVIADFWHTMGISVAFVVFGGVFIGVFVLILVAGNRKTERSSSPGKPEKQSYVNEYYYPVYEYKDRDGTLKQHTSSMGSNMILYAMPDRDVGLLVMPDGAVRRTGLLGLFFGLMFLAPGVFIGRIAVTSFESGPGMIVLLLVIAGVAAYKIVPLWSKISAAFREARETGAFKKENIKLTVREDRGGKGRILEPEEVATRAKVARVQMRIGGYVTLIVSLGLFIGAHYAGQDMIRTMQVGERAQGEVVDLESRSSDDGYTYYAVVRFETPDGRKVDFRDSIGSSSPMKKRGDAVAVIYDPDNVRKAMIDRGIWNWALSGGLALAGILLLWVTAQNFRFARGGTRRYARRV